MNNKSKFIKMLKKGCVVYITYKLSTSELHWVKHPDGSYGEFNLVCKMDDPISKTIMNKVAKLYDYGTEYIKEKL